MSAPSPETSMQTPQREFALQRYTKYLTYANKNEKIGKNARALSRTHSSYTSSSTAWLKVLGGAPLSPKIKNFRGTP